MLKASLNSWKTTTVAILVAAIALLQAAVSLLDADPTTVPDWQTVGTAILAAVGLFLARDADRSSQDAGIRK